MVKRQELDICRKLPPPARNLTVAECPGLARKGGTPLSSGTGLTQERWNPGRPERLFFGDCPAATHCQPCHGGLNVIGAFHA